MRGFILVVSAVLGLACRHRPALPPANLSAPTHTMADLVYEGTVSRRGEADPPLYRYERHVVETADGLRSTHRTFTLQGAPVLEHWAEHDRDYTLHAFGEVHGQTGVVGLVEVSPDGSATYRTTVKGRSRTRTEPAGAPLQAGPTLFGFVLAHWDTLVDGARVPIRFVVLEKNRSFPFELVVVDHSPNTTTVQMVPESRWLARMVPPTYLVFETSSRRILRYSGIVPPLVEEDGKLQTLDATVVYTHVRSEYR